MEPGWAVAGGLDLDESFTSIKQKASDAELNRLTLDENLDEVERTAACLGSSHALQQYFAIRSFPRLLRDSALKQRALALISESSFGFLVNSKSELQQAAACTVQEILDANLLSPVELEEHIFPIVQLMFLNRIVALEESLAASWKQCFFDMMRQLSVSTLRGKLLQIIKERSEYSQPTPYRALAASSVGTMCELLDNSTVEEMLFAPAMVLCQDTEYEVRAIMCAQLSQISRTVSAELVNGRILDELLDLVSDEILMVRLKAVEAVIQMCDVFESSVRCTHILPMLKQLCRQTPDDIKHTLAANFGLLCSKISSDLSADGDSLLCYETFKGLVVHQDVACRKHCAFNFPAVVKSLGAPKFAVHLLDSLAALLADNAVEVRQVIAAGIHEVASMLGTQRTIAHLKPIVITLFGDSSIMVCGALVKNLGILLSQFKSMEDNEAQQALWHEMIAPLLQLEATVRPKWRLQLQLLGQWRKIPEWFTHRNEVYEHFVPVLFTAMHNGPHVVAREAAAVLCVCIRKNSFDFQQRAMCQRISREFARARSWSYRLLFLDLCDQVLDMFSRRFFRAYFLDDVLMMDGDPVSNVRMKLAEMLPAVTATLPDNSVHAEKLEWMLSTMQKDQDRDVAAAARVASAAVQEAGSKSPHSQQLADDLDHRREHEENDDGKAEAAMHSMVLLQRNSSQSGGKRASGILGEHRLSRGGARAKAPSARRLVSERLSSGSHKPESSGSMGTGHGGITRSASDLGRPRAGSLVESKPKKELKGRRGSAGSRSTLSSAPNSTATSSCDSLRSLDRPIEPLVSYKTKELARGRRRNRALSTSSTPPTSIVASNTSMNTTNK